MKDQKIPPLRTLELHSKPLNQQALAWSNDAELAVAADDSVYIFLPEFPIVNPNSLPEPPVEDIPPTGQRFASDGISLLPAGLSADREQGGEDNEDELLSSDSEADMDAAGNDDADDDRDVEMGGTTQNGNTLDDIENRQQFADGCRHIVVARPALTPEINAHIWKVAGKGMPVMHSGTEDVGDRKAGVAPSDNQSNGNSPPADQQHRRDENTAPMNEANPHPGAGIGVIGSAGSSLNHVVAMQWSPAGIGRNLRPVLAVLTGCGSLVIYGEGSPLPFGSTVRRMKRTGTRGQVAVRNLNSWLVLWAVGENFVVPGQEEYGYGEYIKAFAWCQEIEPGKALLAYMNDLKELVILCVSTTFKRMGDGLEEAVWNVKEILRIETSGPHEQANIFDPDFLPGGSSYSVRWGPWLKKGSSWSCLLSYTDSNYVGFRMVTLDTTAWLSKEASCVNCEPNDWDGRCLHLGADAFLEFENMICDFDDKKLCRGFIATPFISVPFEIDMVQSDPNRPKAGHSTDHCKTTYPTQSVTNPIVGLVVHPPDLQTGRPPVVPLYTAVRLSATATNQDWWESNLPQRRNHREEPQWATEIQNKITTRVPLFQADEVQDGDSESGDDGIERDGNLETGKNENQSDEEDEEDNNQSFQDKSQGHIGSQSNQQVHPQRMRLWGIAMSPGGGSTAVLTSSQHTQKPERGTWNHYHSQVLFEFTNRRRKPQAIWEDDDNGNAAACAAGVEDLSTEANLWEWIYGGGPGVLALTYYASRDATWTSSNPRFITQHHKDVVAQEHRDQTKALFIELAAAQTCAICADGQTRLLRDTSSPLRGRQLDCTCEKGHRVAVCGASGMAIMEPGTSRCCGVCQSRCLNVEVLASMLENAGKKEHAEAVRKAINGNVCVQCGGKYLD